MSPSSFSKSLLSIKMDQEGLNYEKQGIVSILSSASEETNSTTSLRRTLSADMSSRKWLAQNGVPSAMKKIASSEEFPVFMEEKEDSSYSEGDDFDRVWSSIQEEKMKNKRETGNQNTERFDAWSSILTQKDSSKSSESLPPPYVHPLLKRSASVLSQKSFDVCTEILGCESSNGFSSYLSWESSGTDQEDKEGKYPEEKVPLPLTFVDRADDCPSVKFNYAPRKKSSPQSFPPPLSSLSFNCSNDGASLKMQSHRNNGRLVLDAVSVPSQHHLRAQRQNGCLVLTSFDSLSSAKATEKEEENSGKEFKTSSESEEIFSGFEEDEGEYFDSDEDDEEEDELDLDVMGDGKGDEINEQESALERAPYLSSGGMINVHRLAITVVKPSYLVSKSLNRFNEAVTLKEENEPTPRALAQSLPPRPQPGRLIPKPPVAAARAAAAAAATASLNAYKCNWRLAYQETSPLNDNSKKFIESEDLVANAKQQQLQAWKEDFLPLLKGCKEPRRPLSIRDSHCIATS